MTVLGQAPVPRARLFRVIARFKDLCLDAGDPARLGSFWAAVLGRDWEAQANGDGLLARAGRPGRERVLRVC